MIELMNSVTENTGEITKGMQQVLNENFRNTNKKVSKQEDYLNNDWTFKMLSGVLLCLSKNSAQDLTKEICTWMQMLMTKNLKSSKKNVNH